MKLETIRPDLRILFRHLVQYRTSYKQKRDDGPLDDDLGLDALLEVVEQALTLMRSIVKGKKGESDSKNGSKAELTLRLPCENSESDQRTESDARRPAEFKP